MSGIQLSIYKKILYLLIVWVLSIFFILVFTEISISFLKNDWSEAEEINVIKNKKISYNIDNLYKSNKKIVTYERNNFGLRDNCNDPSRINILTLGGSTTDQRYINLEDTFQFILQEKINRYNNLKICVSNAGIDGHSTYGHILSFSKWFPLIDNLNPDIIMLFVGINDADFVRLKNNKFNLNSNNDLNSFFKNLNITKFILRLRDIYRGINNKEAYANHRKIFYKDSDYSIQKLNKNTKVLVDKNLIRFRRNLKNLIFESKKISKHIICTTQPHRFVLKKNNVISGIPNVFGKVFSGLDYDYSIRKINEIIYQECGSKNVIDLYGKNFVQSDFYDGVHTTAKGSKKIGKILFEEFNKNMYIKFLN